jgi:hypothetical protein
MRGRLDTHTAFMNRYTAIGETHMEHMPHLTGTVFHVRNLY